MSPYKYKCEFKRSIINSGVYSHSKHKERLIGLLESILFKGFERITTISPKRMANLLMRLLGPVPTKSQIMIFFDLIALFPQMGNSLNRLERLLKGISKGDIQYMITEEGKKVFLPSELGKKLHPYIAEYPVKGYELLGMKELNDRRSSLVWTKNGIIEFKRGSKSLLKNWFNG